MIHTIKVKGCFDCPFRDMENDVCCFLANDEILTENLTMDDISIRNIESNGFLKKCPLYNVKIEIIKVN